MKICYLLVVLAFSLLSACGGSGGGKSDTTPPVITLMGDNPMTIEAGSTFTDPGSSVSDDVDTGLTTIVTGAVDTATTDTYTLSYNVSDAAGNAATTVTRTVNVVLQEAFLGATLECPWDESDPTMHVFLAAGQSNMVSAYGRPGTLPTAYETGTDQLQMWDEGSWKRLGLSTENADHGPRYGPELAFAWTLHAACPDSTIGIVKYAVGGSLISTWVPGGENAAVLVSNITAAIQAHPDITFEGFLYKQGAADGRRRVTAEVWGENFLSIVDAFRNNGITPNTLPFLVGTTRGTADIDAFPDDITDLDPDSVSPPDPSRPFLLHVIHQQWMVQFERPFIYPVIDRDIPKGADETHHTPEGIRMVGRKFAEVYLTQAN
ncbi:hypothetical protein SIN8267_00776 [Sinobacterium norvegicum]|uniref:Pesticidal crystal protein Cry22Aa Ig-like domain-containing protein n=1 Tax=Sinobacterium norvegicum TaxID=1641715 RepID=A0ABN8EIK0_9GAMM|nr:sialate O-acetylesterase [Sinobacterium norvegicum]CAH0990682.1 hypothetical protein SIN8267_00776 [Sinobacterium norvegicum]